jgi:hypothetical protein
MDNTAPTPKKPRESTDFFGAFCFVVLLATVVYASLTAT